MVFLLKALAWVLTGALGWSYVTRPDWEDPDHARESRLTFLIFAVVGLWGALWLWRRKA